MEWIVVANSSRAYIYEAPSRNTLKQILNWEHPSSRMKTEQLVTDFPAHQRGPLQGHSSDTERANPKHNEVMHFVKQLTDFIEKGRARSQFTHLVLIMPPEFLGLALKHLSTSSRDLIRSSIHKDYTQLDAPELRTIVYPQLEPLTL